MVSYAIFYLILFLSALPAHTMPPSTIPMIAINTDSTEDMEQLSSEVAKTWRNVDSVRKMGSDQEIADDLPYEIIEILDLETLNTIIKSQINRITKKETNLNNAQRHIDELCRITKQSSFIFPEEQAIIEKLNAIIQAADGTTPSCETEDFYAIKEHTINLLKDLCIRELALDNAQASLTIMTSFIKLSVENHNHDIILMLKAHINRSQHRHHLLFKLERNIKASIDKAIDHFKPTTHQELYDVAYFIKVALNMWAESNSFISQPLPDLTTNPEELNNALLTTLEKELILLSRVASLLLLANLIEKQ